MWVCVDNDKSPNLHRICHCVVSFTQIVPQYSKCICFRVTFEKVARSFGITATSLFSCSFLWTRFVIYLSAKVFFIIQTIYVAPDGLKVLGSFCYICFWPSADWTSYTSLNCFAEMCKFRYNILLLRKLTIPCLRSGRSNYEATTFFSIGNLAQIYFFVDDSISYWHVRIDENIHHVMTQASIVVLYVCLLILCYFCEK